MGDPQAEHNESKTRAGGESEQNREGENNATKRKRKRENSERRVRGVCVSVSGERNFVQRTFASN